MPKSKVRPAAKKKLQANKNKKIKFNKMVKELEQKAKENPVSYTYHKDATSVVIPIRAWQMLNSLAKELQPLAMLVSTFEQLGQEHINDGTLLPVFKDDIEVEMKDGAPLLINGQVQHKVSEKFWEKHKAKSMKMEVKPSGIVDLSGEDIPSVEKKEVQPQV